jgi:hypothetical protein
MKGKANQDRADSRAEIDTDILHSTDNTGKQ